MIRSQIAWEYIQHMNRRKNKFDTYSYRKFTYVHTDFGFIHMPKCAGTFIRKWLGDWIYNGPNRPYRITDPPYRWGIIKNPFDWWVSWWSIAQFSFDGSVTDRPVGFSEYLLNQDECRPINWPHHQRVWNEGDIKDGMMTKWFKFMFLDDDGSDLADKIIRLEDGLVEQVVDIFNEFIFKLSPEQEAGLRKAEPYNLTPSVRKDPNKAICDYYDERAVSEILHREQYLFDRFGYPRTPPEAKPIELRQGIEAEFRPATNIQPI